MLTVLTAPARVWTPPYSCYQSDTPPLSPVATKQEYTLILSLLNKPNITNFSLSSKPDTTYLNLQRAEPYQSQSVSSQSQPISFSVTHQIQSATDPVPFTSQVQPVSVTSQMQPISVYVTRQTQPVSLSVQAKYNQSQLLLQAKHNQFNLSLFYKPSTNQFQFLWQAK